MTTPRYLTVPDFRRWKRDDIPDDDDLIEQAINAAENLIDSRTGRHLEVASSSTARVFAPHPTSRLLRIHDANTVTSVVENSVTLTVGDDYQLEPLNNRSLAGNYRPYDTIRRIDADWYVNGGKATVTVTAAWGWSAIPAEVVEACKAVAADWLAYRQVRLGVIGATADGFAIGERTSRLVDAAVMAVAGPQSIAVA